MIFFLIVNNLGLGESLDDKDKEWIYRRWIPPSDSSWPVLKGKITLTELGENHSHITDGLKWTPKIVLTLPITFHMILFLSLQQSYDILLSSFLSVGD